MSRRALAIFKVIGLFFRRDFLSILLACGRLLDSRQVNHVHTRQGILLIIIVQVYNLADLSVS